MPLKPTQALVPSFRPSKAVETEFRRRLRQVAREIKRITTGGGDPLRETSLITRQLRQYAELIGPWAQVVAENIVLKMNRINLREWNALAKRLHRGLAEEYASGSRIAVQVEDLTTSAAELITSLPYDAALQVEAKVEHALVDGTRADDLRDFIYERGDVAWQRADLIARTEVSRQSSVLTQARAEDNGSIGYIWHTAEDGRVRPSHDALNGVFIRWDRPPLVDGHYHAHAGQIFNCRCWPEPVFDMDELPKGTPTKYDKDFDEDDHPRDEEGKFTSGGGSSGGGKTKISARGANEPCNGFDSKKLKGHYNDHGRRMGFNNLNDYEKAAIAFLRQPCEGDIDGFFGKDGKLYRYNKRTTEFAVGVPGGKVASYYLAKYNKNGRQISVQAAQKYFAKMRQSKEVRG